MSTAPEGSRSQGSEHAADELMPLVYGELRRLAQQIFGRDRADQTLQPTALVHEAYLRMAGKDRPPTWRRREFTCVAAKAMRQILVNHARDRSRLKRGGGWVRVNLEANEIAMGDEGGVDLVALDEALDELRAYDARQSQVVELRYFGGQSLEEIATTLDVSLATVKRDWTVARAWLLRELTKGDSRGD